jgi:hypothetical protein
MGYNENESGGITVITPSLIYPSFLRHVITLCLICRIREVSGTTISGPQRQLSLGRSKETTEARMYVIRETTHGYERTINPALILI